MHFYEHLNDKISRLINRNYCERGQCKMIQNQAPSLSLAHINPTFIRSADLFRFNAYKPLNLSMCACLFSLALFIFAPGISTAEDLLKFSDQAQQIVGEANSLAEDQTRVWVQGPLIDVHQGPDKGYPILHTLEKGEQLQLHRQYTNWIKITAADGSEGWIHKNQLSKLLDADGRALTDQRAHHQADGTFSAHFSVGTSDGASTVFGSLGYGLSDQLRANVVMSHSPSGYLQGRRVYGQLSFDLKSWGTWQPYAGIGYGIFNADGSFSGLKNFDLFTANLGVRRPVFGSIEGTFEIGREVILIPGPSNIHAESVRLGIMTYF